MAITPKPRLLDKPIVDYLKSQIETGDHARTKRALQHFCKLYRGGYRISPAQVIGVEQSIVGLLYTQGRNEKVRRWGLNALARLGREANCMEAIIHVLQECAHQPQVMAAGIAAVYRMSKKAPDVLKRLHFDNQMITLAALQHVDADKLDLSALPLDVETASSDLLRLALVVVGLDRAPVNMLNPRHDNAQMVKALGRHHDNVVSQYSVWAITENTSLGIGDLGIDLKNIEQQPANVRSWVFQLIAMTPSDATKHYEYIKLGASDPDVEARVGLAMGLRETFFDGIELLVLDWFTTEADQDVSHHLLEHLILQASHCPSYREMATTVYEKEPSGSSLRRRMEACAAGTLLYAEFRRIDFDGSGDLFRGVTNVTNNFHINGGVQGGAVSLGGNAKNSGATSIHYNPQAIEAIRLELAKAERELHTLTLDADVKADALERVAEAKADPSPDKVNKAIAVLGKVQSGYAAAAGAGTAIAEVLTALGRFSGLM